MKIALLVILALSVQTMAANVKHAPVVSFSEPLFAELKAGGKTEGILTILVQKGFHVQANPASQKYLIPTRLELQAAEDITPGKPLYPKGKPYRLKGASDDLSVYEDTFQIKIPVKAETSAKEGEHVLHGKLIYQACDDRSCLPPTSIPVELHVKIT